jgi:hypothetical protein
MAIKYLLITGAGFSSHAGLPLTTDFTRQLLDTQEFTSNSPSSLLVRFLRRFVAEAFDHSEKVSAAFWPELEDIFTCIDLSANTGHHLGPRYAPSELRTVRRALIVRTIRMLRQHYTSGRKAKGPKWTKLQQFFRELDVERCAFLSMNWDTVIEEGLKFRADNVNYGCNARSASFGKSGITLSSVESNPPVHVLKPHGSTNWLYCDTCHELFWFPPDATLRIAGQLFAERDWEIVKSKIGRTRNSDFIKRTCPLCGATALGTRLATFSYRKALDFPMHTLTWFEAEKFLKDAEYWIFIGYSLPAADYEFKHLLKRVQLARVIAPKLILITGGDGAQLTRRNYQKFLGPYFYDDTYFDNGISPEAILKLRAIGVLTGA